MRVVFLNRYFYPDHSATSQMLSDLAFALAENDFRVSVITSAQRYDDPDARLAHYETMNSIDVYRVSTTRFGRLNILGRAIDYLTFYASASRKLWQLAQAGDVIVAKTDPPMLSVIVAPIARAKRASLINWLQDIFPEVAQLSHDGHGYVMGQIYGALAAFRSRSLQSSALNVVLGQRMATKVRALGVHPDKIRIIHNWADGRAITPIKPADNHRRAAWALTEKFVVGYSGNLGHAHDYRTFLEAMRLTEVASQVSAAAASGASQPQHTPDIHWLFIGGGINLKRLQEEARNFGLLSVRFQDYEPRENLSESLSAADIHLVTLQPKLEGLIVPSKYYSICAAGRPTIFVGDPDGEIARILKHDEAGYTVSPGNGAELATYILQLARDPMRIQALGNNARRSFERSYDHQRAMKEWLEAIESVANP
ncbi:MAG: glycosyltransferase WbuB [Hyphomicrobium sp.]|nr:MAG: glycosyltransferase WbuB [Hyphomicrobium sp.]PPD01964.1 MAG: glycosyltransferase WbuB [Hyphomicrobium sp.]